MMCSHHCSKIYYLFIKQAKYNLITNVLGFTITSPPKFILENRFDLLRQRLFMGTKPIIGSRSKISLEK